MAVKVANDSAISIVAVRGQQVTVSGVGQKEEVLAYFVSCTSTTSIGFCLLGGAVECE